MRSTRCRNCLGLPWKKQKLVMITETKHVQNLASESTTIEPDTCTEACWSYHARFTVQHSKQHFQVPQQSVLLRPLTTYTYTNNARVDCTLGFGDLEWHICLRVMLIFTNGIKYRPFDFYPPHIPTWSHLSIGLSIWRTPFAFTSLQHWRIFGTMCGRIFFFLM